MVLVENVKLSARIGWLQICNGWWYRCRSFDFVVRHFPLLQLDKYFHRCRYHGSRRWFYCFKFEDCVCTNHLLLTLLASRRLVRRHQRLPLQYRRTQIRWRINVRHPRRNPRSLRYVLDFHVRVLLDCCVYYCDPLIHDRRNHCPLVLRKQLWRSTICQCVHRYLMGIQISFGIACFRIFAYCNSHHDQSTLWILC